MTILWIMSPFKNNNITVNQRDIEMKDRKYAKITDMVIQSNSSVSIEKVDQLSKYENLEIENRNNQTLLAKITDWWHESHEQHKILRKLSGNVEKLSSIILFRFKENN